MCRSLRPQRSTKQDWRRVPHVTCLSSGPGTPSVVWRSVLSITSSIRSRAVGRVLRRILLRDLLLVHLPRQARPSRAHQPRQPCEPLVSVARHSRPGGALGRPLAAPGDGDLCTNRRDAGARRYTGSPKNHHVGCHAGRWPSRRANVGHVNNSQTVTRRAHNSWLFDTLEGAVLLIVCTRP